MASKTKIPVKIKLVTRDHELRKVFIRFTSLQCYLFCGLLLHSRFCLRNFLRKSEYKGSAKFSIFDTHLLVLK